MFVIAMFVHLALESLFASLDGVQALNRSRWFEDKSSFLDYDVKFIDSVNRCRKFSINNATIFV